MTGPITPLPSGVAEPLSAMHAVCFPDEPWDTETTARILALSGVFGYVAWQDDDPAGFLLARDLGDEIEVLSLGVAAALRRRGIGRALLDAVAREAARRRVGSIVLEVAADNDAARRLYAALGFVQVGRRPRYYRRAGGLGDGLILRRSIRGQGSGR